MNLRFETWQPADARRHYLDVLRGLAALLVLVSHSDHVGLLDFGLTSLQKGFIGVLGVYLFFMLSGFLIWTSAKNLARPGGTTLYAIHRFSRLVPLYLVNLAFVVLLLPHLPSAFRPEWSLEVLWRHLTFTQALLPDVSRAFNPVLWTLTHEVLFYALVPLLVRLPVLAIPALGLAAFVFALRVATPLGPFLGLFYLFSVGILLAEGRFKTAMAAIAVFTWAVATSMEAFRPWVVATAGLMMLVGLLLPARGLRFTMALKWIGMISFSLYIWHYLVINIIGTESGLRALSTLTFEATSRSPAVLSIVFLGAVLAVSLLSYWLVERPSMNQLRRFLVARVQSPARAAEETTA